MANEIKNVYQKLIEARSKFLQEGVKKTGVNLHLSFKYFELTDIVPVATKIFKELGLVAIPTFTNEEAKLTLVNCDKPDETIVFTAPVKQIQSIVSNQGKVVTNEVQTLGSSITYYRRYLYQLCLDICECDDLDANAGNEVAPEKAPSKKRASSNAPATPEERKEIKEELTNVEEQASELQIKALKKVLKELRTVAPDKENFITEFIAKTNNLTQITKQQAEQAINNISDVVEAIKHPSLEEK